MVERNLKAASLPASALELEITEGTLMGNGREVMSQLRELKSMGVRLAVDDFGTGYSSLAYLCTFPVDILKIDKRFVSGVRPESSEAILMDMIVALGWQLGLTVVVEGVETRVQWQQFIERGCDEFQGFLFAPPMPPEELSEWFRERRHEVLTLAG